MTRIFFKKNIWLKEQWSFFSEIMTQRIELIFFFLKHMTLKIELIKKSKNWSFFTNMTHSKNSSLLNLFIWLKELNLFPQNDSKILFFGLDSELIFWLWLSEWYCFVYFDFYNWTFFILRPKGLNFFFDLIWPKRLFFLIWVTESNTFFEHDWKNWTLRIRLKELNHSFSEWLKDLNFFWNMTQWIELFSIWLKELNLFCHSKELNLLLFLFHDAKELNPFFDAKTQLNTFLIQRIEHSFWTRLTELNSFFGMWLKELNRIFKNLTQRIEHSSLGDKELNLLHKMTQRIEPFCEHDSQKLFWITTQKFLMKYDSQNSKNWTFFSQMSRRIELFEEKTWLTELNPFFHVTHGIEPFFPRWAQEIEPFFFTWLKELNPSFFELWLKELNFFEYWLKELNLEPFFKNLTQRIWTFFSTLNF